MKTRIDHLHRELLLEILVRLPGKSLHRCKCVRKSWNRIINTILKNRALLAEHLKRSLARPSLILRIPNSYAFRFRNSRKRIAQEFVAISNSKAEVVFLDYSVRRLCSASVRSVRRASNSLYTPHCDGIICLHHFNKNSVAVINPGLGRYRILDEYSFFGKNRKRDFHYVGFGFDTIHNVYKVVRVVFAGGFTNFAEIWTLGKGARKQIDGWRMIKVHTDHKYTGNYPYIDHQVHCSGVYYWSSNEGLANGNNPILSFDMRSETFQTIAMPPFVEPSPQFRRRCTLLVWRNECVILLKYRDARCYWARTTDRDPKLIELWVLGEDGSSWSKFVTIPPLDDMYHPLTFWNGDELLLKSYPFTSKGGGDHLASYNIVTKSFRKLQGTPNIEREIYASTYVQSLIWI